MQIFNSAILRIPRSTPVSYTHLDVYKRQDADLPALENKTTPEWQRIAFDELLAQQLSMRKHYARRRSLDAPQFKQSKQFVSALLKSLPFALTRAQQKVAIEIERDLTQAHPMQRLLQGDVGSGKTIVACMAALQSIESGWQVALMAPTEILAEQHFRKMMVWLTPLNIQIAWLTGSQSKKDRESALQTIADGSAQLVIGTHALFQEAVQFKKLGLAIIDEQHRFGVQQRLALRQKGQPEPHQLMMTATPIPRTLSTVSYTHLYPMRYRVLTKVIKAARGNRKEVISKILESLENKLKEAGIEAEVTGREKHLYSIYKKMAGKTNSFSQIYDIYGFRIVVKDLPACYLTLGALHGLFKPIPGKFKDYIAIPKANGYQSLHTTLFGPFGTPIEVQIRSQEMHNVANAGVAAHWLYKSTDAELTALQQKTHQWLQRLLEIQTESVDSLEFLEHVKVDLFPNEVYVFTPKGNICLLYTSRCV